MWVLGTGEPAFRISHLALRACICVRVCVCVKISMSGVILEQTTQALLNSEPLIWIFLAAQLGILRALAPPESLSFLSIAYKPAAV